VADADIPPPAEAPSPGGIPDDPGAAHRRTVLFTAVGAVVVAALLFAVVARVAGTKATSGRGATDSSGARLARFELGRAKDFAPTIARGGPILLPDPQGHSRDIFVQHLGGDDWRAFEARAAGSPRQCILSWEQAARRFVDPCDGREYPADGAGLVSFVTIVNDDGKVVVDLSHPVAPAAPATTTTTTTEPY
jgi:hypothetical protein